MMLSTFKWYPKNLPDIEKFVAAGFYYTGFGEKLACIKCNVKYDFKLSDEPWIVHEKISPNCPLVRHHKRNN